MADVEVTLNHSENYSSSTAKTYRGYVINLCDDSHVDDGTWSPSSYDGIGVSIDENKITIWNTNTTGSSVSNIFTWTSYLVSGCTKTLSVTVPGAVVTLKSGNTEIVVTAIYDKSGTVYNTIYEDEFLINGSSEGIVTTLSVLTGETITTCNGDMDNYWNNYIRSTSNTNQMMFAFTNGLNTHLIGCSDDYNSLGSYTINLKYYDREMTISFPVTFNLIATKDYCPSVSIELYDNSNNVISGTSTAGNNIHIKITINNWKDIPESNKKKFDYFENGGNNIIYSLPDGYVMGFNFWDGSNNFNIIGGLSDECPEGDYTFSVTVCDNTVSKTTTKSSTQQPCPDFYVSESDFKIYPYDSKTIRLHINNWNSTTTITDYTFTKYFDIVSITKTNMTYSVGSYNDIDEYYPITITHEFNGTNDSSDRLDITIYSKNSDCDNSANIKCHLKLGYFNVTFNTNGVAIPSGKYVEVFIDCNGVKQRVAAITGTTSSLNQREAPIWHSVLDTGSNAGTCPSRSFTVIIDDSNVTSAVITSATSATIDNTCTSDDFNITCNVIF